MRGALARPIALAALATLAVPGGGCGRAGGGEGALLRALGDEVDLVIVADPDRVAGTWVERAAAMLVPSLPACVRDRARAADAIAATWSQRDGQDGDWTLVLIGGGATATGCEALERGGGLAWYGPDPRRGEHHFFARPDRKRRWRALGDAPIRAVGDLQLQAGIVVHAGGTLDPRDGVDARTILRFDERAAADGFEQLRQRHTAQLDRERLGGAWPAFDTTLRRDPADPAGATLRGELRLPGASGEEAMIFATSAYLAGELVTPGAPCPWIADTWSARVSCTGSGPFVVAASLRDEVLADPALLTRDARVVPAIQNGAAAGFKLYAIRPTSLVAALGLQNGDRVHTVGGESIAGAADALATFERVRHASQLTIELERRGRAVALRYEIR